MASHLSSFHFAMIFTSNAWAVYGIEIEKQEADLGGCEASRVWNCGAHEDNH
jgi:hypothetical protein